VVRGDFHLLERLTGDAAMMIYLGGPESSAKIRERHERYCLLSDTARVFAILVGSERQAAGWVGYWEKDVRGQPAWETGWRVLPEFQGQGIATRATAIVVERARAEGRYQFMHAFPSVENGPSNAICRKLDFTRIFLFPLHLLILH
jgi:RimJ/RimL family protein N-acetyltransferase